MKKKPSFGKLLPVIGAVLLLYLISATTAFAATGNTRNKGAEFPQYSEVKEIHVSSGNFSREFRDALWDAAAHATDSVQYKIILPQGTFTQGHAYTLPSNTYIYAVGTTIISTDSHRSMFHGDMTNPSRNIIMEGGTWKTSQKYKGDATAVRFTGVRNLMLKDMSITANRVGHVVELADVIGCTITGCTISGNNASGSTNVQPKEALQLDIATKAAIPGYNTASKMYNGKGCHNIMITNNTFVNCARGLGSHSGLKGAEKNPYTYITVQNNVIKNCLGEAIFGQNWKNTTITGNTIQKCKQTGIYLLDTNNIVVTNNKISNVRRYTGQRQKVYDAKKKYGCGVLIRRTKNVTVKGNKVSNVSRMGKTKGIIKEK